MSELPALASSTNNASGFQQMINAVAIRLSSGNSVSAPVVEQVCLGFEYCSNGEDRIVVLLLGLVFPVQAHGYPAGGVPAVRHSNATIRNGTLRRPVGGSAQPACGRDSL